MLADASGTEPVLELLGRAPVEAEDRHHHVLAVAVGGGHGGVDVDPPVRIIRVNNFSKNGFRIRTLAATPCVSKVFYKLKS